MDPELYIERLGQIVAAKQYAPLAEQCTDDQQETIRALMATVGTAPPPKPAALQGGAVVLRSRADALD